MDSVGLRWNPRLPISYGMQELIPGIVHRTSEELEVGLDQIRCAPRQNGIVEMIVRRPETGTRQLLERADLTIEEGLAGDRWKMNAANPSEQRDTQLTLMNSRAIALVASEKHHWQWAGDQLFVDFDLSIENLPAGTQLSVGQAIVEVTSRPHLGCKKFMARFGEPALQFVNSPVGKQLRLRGLNAKVVKPGSVEIGDAVRKLQS